MATRDTLPSWNHGAAKAAILDLLARVTKKGCGHDSRTRGVVIPPQHSLKVVAERSHQEAPFWCSNPSLIQQLP